ncbi:MAG: patatin-like phospholipase family protein [Acidobacteria bacterium]|nr:patatin-like phospholipase family protein [Acidobacteriota bacterium]
MRTILSIDGGGIRGIIPALLLAELESRLQRRTAVMFDLIAGTSTGGILALGLARPDEEGKPRYTAAELSELYEQQGRTIFHRAPWKRWLPVGVIEEKYPSSGIEQVLEKYFGEARLRDAVTPVLVTSYDIERRMPFFFRSRRAQLNPDYDWPMKAAARATSAAPTYFEPLRLGAHGTAGYYALIDGGVFANNPAMCALAEAREIFRDEDLLVVSLGTGGFTRPIAYDQARKWGVAGWAKPVLEIVFDGVSSSVDYQLRHMLDGVQGKRRYFRFQVTLDPKLQAMDATGEAHLRGLKLLAEAEMRARRPELDQLCALLDHSAIPSR